MLHMVHHDVVLQVAGAPPTVCFPVLLCASRLCECVCRDLIFSTCLYGKTHGVMIFTGLPISSFCSKK